jgi:hypothetical protein
MLLADSLHGSVDVVGSGQQGLPASPQNAGASPAVENNGQDFTRPETLFQLRYFYQTAPGSGAVPSTMRTVTRDAVILRSDLKVDLAPQWTLALRGDLPFAAKDSITSDNPSGGYVYGLGDADVQAALIRTLNAQWAVGAGLRIVAPTGSDDLTSGKWQVLPIIGARYMLPALSEGSFIAALIRYDVSFAGDSAAKNISNLQFAPTLSSICQISGSLRSIQTPTYGSISAIQSPVRPDACSCQWMLWWAAR